MNLNGLLPVKLYNKVEMDKDYIGKTISHTILEAKDGREISRNMPTDWLVYARDALNEYYKITRPLNVPSALKPIVAPTHMATFVLPGEPIEKSNGNAVTKGADGEYMLSTSKEYSERIKFLKDMSQRITVGRNHLIPIKTEVIVECIFHINKNGKRKHSLPDLVSSTIDILVRLEILKSGKNDVVARADGSAIIYTTEASRTVINIKSFVREK